MRLLHMFMKNEDGATAIEYALIAGIVGIGIVLSLTQLTSDLKTLFTRVSAGFA